MHDEDATAPRNREEQQRCTNLTLLAVWLVLWASSGLIRKRGAARARVSDIWQSEEHPKGVRGFCDDSVTIPSLTPQSPWPELMSRGVIGTEDVGTAAVEWRRCRLPPEVNGLHITAGRTTELAKGF